MARSVVLAAAIVACAGIAWVALVRTDHLHRACLLTSVVWARLLSIGAQLLQPESCQCPNAAGKISDKRKDAIVILSTRRNAKLLFHCLTLLYKNFNKCFRKDVLIFHNGDFSNSDLAFMHAQLGPEIQLHYLERGGPLWGPPPALQNKTHQIDWLYWSPSYFHMMRWYGVLMYNHLRNLGYDWFMRLDDDSELISCISYDMFEFMERRNYTYAYRVEHNDGPFPTSLVQVVIAAFQKAQAPIPDSLARRFPAGLSSPGVSDGRYFYNNFCISKTSFWTEGGAAWFLRTLDESGLMYRGAIFDAPLQTLVVLGLLAELQVWRFTDWSYSHHPRTAVALHPPIPAFVAAILPLFVTEVELTAGLDLGNDILQFKNTFGDNFYGHCRRAFPGNWQGRL